MLRETLLAMTLDLEHFQRVSLLHKLEEREDEDDFKRVKSIRNPAAHSSCLINSFSSSATMSRSASKRILAEVSKTDVSRATGRKRMSNPAVQEIATVLVLYAQIVPNGESRTRTIDKLRSFFAKVNESRELLPEEGDRSSANIGRPSAR